MHTQEFDQFVSRLQGEPSAASVDWEKVRAEWLNDLTTLYKCIEAFLATYTASGQIHFAYEDVRLIEEYVGAYDARQMVIKIGRREVRLIPIGRNILGAKGRVDAEGMSGRAQLLLVDKKATNPASLIKVIRPGSKSEIGAAEGATPTEWEWKIVERPPQREFIPLTKDAFFALLMKLADGF